MAQREEEFIAIVDLEMNSNLTTANENSYFVRCPILSKEFEQKKENGNLSAKIGPLDAEMRIIEEKGQMMNLSLETAKGQKGGRELTF
jgi:hypothetical protein